MNLLFGCNVPRIIAIIIAELGLEEKYKAGEYERTFYEFDEMTPEENDREVLLRAEEEEIERIEIEQAIEQRKEYIRHVTDEIMTHITDMGIVVFFPHVMKEAYRKTADIADKMELTCKERKCVKLKPEMLEILHFEIENPLPDDLLEFLYSKEVLIFLFKLGEADTRSPEEALNVFFRTIAHPTPILDEHGENASGHSIPPILDAIELAPGEEIPEPKPEILKGNRKFPPKPQPVVEKKPDDPNVKKVRIPAAWTPTVTNRRATAAYIYIFFRNVCISDSSCLFQ